MKRATLMRAELSRWASIYGASCISWRVGWRVWVARWLRTLVSFQKKGARQCFSRLPAVIDGIYMSWLESWVSSRCIWLSSGSRT